MPGDPKSLLALGNMGGPSKRSPPRALRTTLKRSLRLCLQNIHKLPRRFYRKALHRIQFQSRAKLLSRLHNLSIPILRLGRRV